MCKIVWDKYITNSNMWLIASLQFIGGEGKIIDVQISVREMHILKLCGTIYKMNYLLDKTFIRWTIY